ncbi:hypothetical protein DM860_003706 [Cuscuta australis]|uniref:Xylanase inhibitor C-terminal domain-containing protein n=1 Tax=Cuscuta australis TaxID=267555 RepID=A0A328DGV0_9ASTE|nr:hypothetical protein DM860_003706 [Cuscuta australis]
MNASPSVCVYARVKVKIKIVNLNSYEPGSSSTSEVLLCNSSYCSEPCPLPAAPTPPPCPYEINYMSENTCGEVETGLFLGRGGLNGLLGLGHTSLDVTTLLSSQGLIRNSFSMCFAPDGNGRIAFGDKGDADQRVTPLVDAHKSAQYNVRVDRIYVNDVVAKVGFKAIFDSGTSLTYLAGEAYAVVTQAFVSLVKDLQRIEFEHPFFEYCYIPGTSNNSASFGIPSLIFKTKGGANFSVMSPMISIKRPQQVTALLLIEKDQFSDGNRLSVQHWQGVLGWGGQVWIQWIEFHGYQMHYYDDSACTCTTITCREQEECINVCKDHGGGSCVHFFDDPLGYCCCKT